MGAFDEWVCDPQITRGGVEAFVTGRAPAGPPYLGRYFACTRSGTTGHPRVFVHDQGACAVYEAMGYRMDLAWLSGRQWRQMLYGHSHQLSQCLGGAGHRADGGAASPAPSDSAKRWAQQKSQFAEP